MAAQARTWQAVLLLIGTIVGVGMFGIPFVFGRAGFLTGVAELAFLTAATVIVHLAYAEVVGRTAGLHRLPGYVSLYLGRAAGGLARLSYLFGPLLAYLVLGGFFLGELLREIFPGMPPLAGPAAFYLGGVAVVYRGIRFESFANAVLTVALIAAMFLLAFSLLPHLEFGRLGEFGAAEAFAPYGVILFSLAGAAIIPDVKRFLGPEAGGRLGAVVAGGAIGAAALYLIFAASVFGAGGPATTPDAVSGLAALFGAGYRRGGAVVGFLATITSFITLGIVLKGTFVSDFGYARRTAWLWTAVIPATLFLLGFQDFITIIGLIGAVAVGLDSLFILLVHRAAARAGGGTPGVTIVIPDIVRFALVLLFAAGVVYEFVTLAGFRA